MLLKYNFLLGKKLLEKGVGNELMMRVMRFTKDSRRKNLTAVIIFGPFDIICSSAFFFSFGQLMEA
jgi:hypothetical protein